MNTDNVTTAAGSAAAIAILTQVDWHLVGSGNLGEIGKVVGALATAIWGWYTNKYHKPTGSGVVTVNPPAPAPAPTPAPAPAPAPVVKP